MFRLNVEEYAERVADLPVRPSAVQVEQLQWAVHRVAAEDLRSPVDLPLFRNSQMDGFAARSADVAGAPVELPVVAEIPAGAVEPQPLAHGGVARIMTGAPLPDGADCVIPVEDTTDAGEGRVRIERGRGIGEYVRNRGSDVHSEEVLVPAGTLLEPRHLAALAAAGVAEVPVLGNLSVPIITTGAELLPPGEPLTPGRIYDANRVALETGLAVNGIGVGLRRRTSDDPEEFAAAFEEVHRASLVLTSGGVSKGAYEVVRDVLEPRGVEFGSVAMQPGGPQGIGVVDGTPVLCFPGNPVSTQVSFAVFARPLLRRVAGLPPIEADAAELAHAVSSVPGRRQFLRGLRTGGIVEIVGGPGSHLVAAMARANVLVDVPAETTELAAGETVRVLPL